MKTESSNEAAKLEPGEELFVIDITADTVDSLPDVSHWRKTSREIEGMRRELLGVSMKLAGIIDGRYNGAAQTRLQSAEHAVREALRELHIAYGIMI